MKHDLYTILGSPGEWWRACEWQDELDDVLSGNDDGSGFRAFYESSVLALVELAHGRTHLPGYFADEHTRQAPVLPPSRPEVSANVLRAEWAEQVRKSHPALAEYVSLVPTTPKEARRDVISLRRMKTEKGQLERGLRADHFRARRELVKRSKRVQRALDIQLTSEEWAALMRRARRG